MTTSGRPDDRATAIGDGVSWLARWSLRLTLIGIGAVGAWLLLAQLWVIVLPVLLAILLATVLWAPTGWLRRHRFRPALAAGTVVVVAVGIDGGAVALLAPVLADGVSAIVDRSAFLRRARGRSDGGWRGRPSRSGRVSSTPRCRRSRTSSSRAPRRSRAAGVPVPQ